MTGGKKRVLIVAPHFPPSNLAAVHRSRLFAQHLPAFGWEPVIITVHPDYYEEKLDPNLERIVAADLRIERVGAVPTRPVRTVGDVGVRGFVPMLRRILQIIDREGADFLYITIPSFFAAPLGRIVHALRGVPYGIDYIDPWVHVWPGSERPFNRHWASRKLGEILEPWSVRNAALITGVAEGYYHDVFLRNPHLEGRAIAAAMPYGGEAADHEAVRRLGLASYLFRETPGVFRLVYAGAMLPRAFAPLEAVFAAIAERREAFAKVEMHFIGTGSSPDDLDGYNVRPVAERYGLWGSVIHEHPARIPYLDVLAHLEAADAVFVLGSTEPHYTPSKVYQGVLSGKPVLAVLHQASTACAVLQETGAGLVLAFSGEKEVNQIETGFADLFLQFRAFADEFDPANVDRTTFDAYSARNVTYRLITALDEALARHQNSISA